MAQLQSVFVASTLKSNEATVAKYMEYMNLDRVVFFVVRNPSTRLRDDLHAYMRDNELTRILLPASKRHPKTHRMLVIARTEERFPDAQYIEEYRYLLKQIYSPKCRYSVRICRRYTYLV